MSHFRARSRQPAGDGVGFQPWGESMGEEKVGGRGKGGGMRGGEFWGPHLPGSQQRLSDRDLRGRPVCPMLGIFMHVGEACRHCPL